MKRLVNSAAAAPRSRRSHAEIVNTMQIFQTMHACYFNDLASIGASRCASLRGGLGNEISDSHLPALMYRPICLMHNIHFGAGACHSLTYAASSNAAAPLREGPVSLRSGCRKLRCDGEMRIFAAVRFCAKIRVAICTQRIFI